MSSVSYIKDIIEIAAKISTPLALSGLFAAVLFFVLKQIVAKNIFPKLNRKLGADILKLIITRLFILALVAMIFGFIGYVIIALTPKNTSMEKQQQSSDKQFRNLLLESSQELRSNREYLRELRAFIQDKNRRLPIGSIKYERTLSLLGDHYGRVTKYAYGEQKYIYQLALQLKDISQLLNGFRTREDYLRWNNTYEMTVDDISFLCGFVFWYIAHVAEAELTPELFYSLGWGPLSNEFASDKEIPNLNMRYFIHEGKPIVDYLDYLGLID